jgi:hypothetical protein
MKNSNSFPTEFYLMRQVGIGTMPLSLFLTHALLTTREVRRRQKKSNSTHIPRKLRFPGAVAEKDAIEDERYTPFCCRQGRGAG